jgi:fibronectin-binding autotransporter adhesin
MHSSLWTTWLHRLARAPYPIRGGRGARRERCASLRPALETLEERLTPTSHTWVGGVDSNWSTAENWGAGGSPLTDLSATIVFDASKAVRKASVNNVGNVSVNAIQFLGGGFTLSSSLANSKINVGAGGLSSDNALVLSAPLINLITLNTISSDLVFDAVRTISVPRAGQGLELSGVLSGAGGLTKTGVGPLTLSGSKVNTYAGTTTVSAGNLRLNKPGSDGAVPGDLTIGSTSITATSAVVSLSASAQIANRGTVRINGRGTLNLNDNLESIGALNMTGGTILLGTSGALTLIGDVTATSTTVQQISGNVVSNVPVSALISGGGSASLAMVTPTQTFTVNDGPATDDLILGATATGFNLVKAGAGQMVLGVANTYPGQTSINAGVLKVTNAAALGIGGAVVASGATLEVGIVPAFGTALPAITQRLSLSGTGVGNTGALRTTTGGALWSGNITLASDVTINTPADNLVVSGTIDGPGGLTKLGGSTLELKAANSYAGPTAVNGGTLRFDNVAGLGTSTTPIPVAGGATLNAVGSFTVNRAVQLSDRATLAGSTGATGGTAPTWAGNLTLLGEGFLGGGNISGLISGPGGPSVTGVVAFTGTQNNTYAGITRVGNFLTLNRPGATAVPGELHIGEPFVPPPAEESITPTLFISSNEQIPDTAPVSILLGAELHMANNVTETIGPLTMKGGTVGGINFSSNGVLILNGDVTATTGTISSNANVSLGSATRTFSLTVPSTGLDVQGTLSGNPEVGLVKEGPGLLKINGKSTYNGPTTINGGIMQVEPFVGATTQTLPSAITVNDGGTLTGTTSSPAQPNGISVQSVGGTVSPGDNFFDIGGFTNHPGTVAVSGNVTLDSTSHLVIQLNGTSPATIGIGHDQLIVGGALDLGGAELNLTLGFVSQVGDTFVIVKKDSPGDNPTRFAGLPDNGSPFILKDPAGNDERFLILYGGGDGNDVELVHINSGSAFQNRQVTSPINEGELAKVTGTIDDPDTLDTFFLVADWGDGSPVETFSFAPGTPRDVSILHRYLNNGTFPISLSWHDEHGEGSNAGLSVVVQNVAPVVSVGPPATLRVGQTLTRIGSITDPGADHWTATVDFGDGSGSQPLSVGANKQFQLKHRYRRSGKFRVTVTVRDGDGGVGTASFLVTVKRKP